MPQGNRIKTLSSFTLFVKTDISLVQLRYHYQLKKAQKTPYIKIDYFL